MANPVDIETGLVIEVAGFRLTRFKSYNIETGIFTWPSSFNIETGSSVDVGTFRASVPPNSLFRALVNKRVQFEGRINNPGASGNKSGTTLKLHGNTLLERLRKGMPKKERTFKDESTVDIIKLALADVGLSDIPLIVDTTQSRSTRAGVKIVTLKGVQPGTPAKQRLRKANIGTTWSELIGQELHHSGLFLIELPGPSFAVDVPDTQQDAIYRIWRRADLSGNVEDFNFDNNTTSRYAEVDVYNGGGKRSPKYKGDFVDDEMVGWGFTERFTAKDTHITSDEEAAFYASRKNAEHRRAGWKLEYTVSGHDESLVPGGPRAVWTPNTCVEVDDDVLGIHGKHWIEHVAMSLDLGGGSLTKLRLQRLGDLKFGTVGG